MGTCHCTTVEAPVAQCTAEKNESSHQFEYLTQRYYMEQEHLRKHVFPSNEVLKIGRRNSIANKTEHSCATTHYSYDIRSCRDLRKITSSEITMYEDKCEDYMLEKDSQYGSICELHLSKELRHFRDLPTTPQKDIENASWESDLYLPDEDIKKLEQYFSASDSGSTSIVRIYFEHMRKCRSSDSRAISSYKSSSAKGLFACTKGLYDCPKRQIHSKIERAD